MQAKLDELIRALEAARGQFIGIEHLTDREISKIRSDLEAECKQSQGKPPADKTVERLLRRY